ncbi:MAG: YIP1 family protein [Chloroflexi bacterium]|nr:YIP1 family protein [Chloroflexota bacterium]
MLDRIMGVVTLKAPTYREIADDQNATGQAAIIVVVMAFFSAIVGAIILVATSSMLPPEAAASAGSPIGAAFRTLINQIIGWFVGAWVIAFVSKTFFGGKTNTGEMLRVFGYTQVFGILNIIPCLGTIAALVLSLVAAVIGIREASEFDTTKAVLTAIVAFVVLLIVGSIIGLVFGLVGL